MKNLYYNSIVKKLKQIVVLSAILLGFSTTANAQVKKAFTQRTSTFSPTRKVYNVKGDFTMLGNTCLTLQNYRDDRNNNNQTMVYVDTDNDNTTFNSSSSTLVIASENGSTPECSDIVFAGLYWTGKGSPNATFNVTKNNVTKTFNKRIIKLKGPSAGSYTDITANAADIYYPSGSEDDIYSGYAEITSYVRQYGLGQYTVADMALLEGGSSNGTGYSGGWGIIVVYQNSKMKYRDVTIFDGYAYVEAGNSSAGIELPVSGFNTVQSGNVGMKIGFMASEGDVGFTGDYFKIRNLATANYTTLSRAANGVVPNPDNFFNSSITVAGNRNPNLNNNTGIDIGIVNIPNTNNTIIGNSQTSTKFLYGTNGDTYSIFTIAMSVDAYVPEAEATLTTTTINNQPAVLPYTILPGQDAGFSIDVRNLGTEPINNYQVVVPLPYNATYVAGSATGTLFYTLPNATTITGTYNPSLGATGSIVWNFGTLPLPANPSTLLARLTFKLKATTDCGILANSSCASTIPVNGSYSGVGANTLVALNSALIQGYTVNGNCAGQVIPTPLNIGINGVSYVQQNCPGTDYTRHFSYCSANTTVLPSEIASNFPAGSSFYNSFPVTVNSVQYTDANPIPLVAGSTVTYYAVPSGGGSGCNFPFTITKCPVIVAQNDALTGGNGTAGNPNAGNVLNNNGSGPDTLNGVQAAISQVNITVTTPAVSIGGNPVPVLNTTTGQVSVPAGTPAGTYTIVYNLCEKLNPTTNCDPATVTITVTAPAIIAQNDAVSGGNGTAGNPNAGNVLNDNGSGPDTLNGSPVTISQVNISITTPATPIGGNPVPVVSTTTGQISVPAGTPAGTYTIVYNLCEKLNPTNCDPATVTITVTAPAIIAQDDTLSGGNGTTGNPNAGNVLNNNGNGPDTLNGNPVTISQVNISITTPATSIGGAPVPSLDTATGQVSVPSGTPAGTYTIVYNLCEKLNPTNCDPATVTITVTAPAIIAQDDTLSGGNGTTGNPNAGNVLNNNGNGPDTLNGNPVTISQINISVTTPATSIGGAPVPTLDTATGQVSVPSGTPAGTYTIVYNLCEKLNPTNCDPATVTITVTAPAIIAQDDTLSGGNGTIGNPNAGNVLNNNGNGPDTLNGNPATISQVNISVTTPATSIGGAPVPTLATASGQVSVPAGTPAGTYTIVYNLCEKLNPTNCDPATVTITVTAPVIIAQDDAISGGNGTTGNPNVGNVLNNNGNGPDTLNGNPVTIGQVNISITTPATPIGGNPVPVVSTTTGDISVPPGTPAGTYTIVYNLCEKLNPTNCDPATVTITVTPPAIIANDDAGAPVNGLTGGVGYTNVLVNDTLNGQPVLAAQVNTTFVSSSNAGITLSGTNVLVAPGTPAGSYTLTYQICEILNPTNCDTAIVTVAVSPAQIIANDDAGNPVNGLTGGVGYTNVLVNDTLNGLPVLATQVNTTFVSSTNAGITLSGTDVLVAPGTPAGSYTLTYQICEILNPTNCDTAIVTVNVYTPSIDLLKNGTYVDSLAPTGVSVGDTIVYNFTVINTGGSDLTNVTVTDPLVNVVGGPLALLPVGASDTTTFTATYTITQADIDAGQVNNLATATGTPPSGPPVTHTSTDPTPCTTCNPVPNCPACTITPLPANPAIAITKDGTFNDLAPLGITNPGDTVTYNFVVTNTGNVTLTNITVTDNNAVVTGGPLASLAVGASNATTFTAVHTITQADIDAGVVYNLATATGNPPFGPPVTGTSTDPTPCTTCPSNPPCTTCTSTPIINANNDVYTNVACNVTAITGNILSNDTFGSLPVNSSAATQVTLTILTGSYPNISIANNGDINFTSGVAAGSYTFTYQICSALTPNVCDQASVTINVVDTTPPVMTDASNATVQCDGAGNNAALQAWLAAHGGATASDTCSNITWSNNFNGLSDGCGNTGSATVTFTATDDSGNASTTTATFTIEDTTAPSINTVAANATVQCDGNGNTAALQAWLTSNGGAAAADICSNVTWTNNYTALSDGCGNTGSATVTFTATDDCGNTATTSATFTIEDTTAPTIDTAAANATVQCDGNGNTAALQAWLTSNGGAAASDICSNVTWTNNFTALSDGCGNSGSATVTFTATDDCGNTATTSATFTIEDTTAPTIDTAAANATVQCDGQGNTAALQAWLTSNGGAAASDACSNVTWTNSFTALSDGCGNTGFATVTFTATDDCGNATTTSATFTIEDTTAPTIDTAAANATVQCDGNGNTQALQAWLTSNGGAVASDICSNVTWSNDFTALSDGCGNTGAATVTFTATDDCGNTTTTSAIFTIEDTLAPTIDTAAANATVQCDGQGNTAALQAWLTSNGGAVASDACSNVTWSNNYTELSDGCGNTGSATVTFTATDDCGNSVITSAIFTIEDTTAPSIDTAATNITVQCNGAGNTGALEAWLTSNGGAVASDVCSGVTWTNNFASLSSDCSTAVNVTFTATDACGNASTTSATFTVEDTVAPTIDTAAANATVQCDGQGNTAALQAWLTSNGGAAASDTCTNVTWSNNFDGLSDGCGNTGAATVTFTATDACGNTATTSAVFTIEDTTAPTIDTAASNATVQCDGQGNTAALQAWLASSGGAAASDICSNVTWTNNFDGLSDGCGNTGSASVTFTATDDCGNTATTSATFTIEDTTAPTIDTAAANATVQCDGNGNTEALQAWLTSNGGAVASDICSGSVTWTNNFDGLSDGCGNTGSASVTFTATDACGNTVTTSASFTIEDTTAPTIDTAASNITVQCNGAGNTGALEAWLTSNGGAVASDACSGVTWTNNFASLSSDCSTAVNVTFTATDACGNASTTSATFTVEDTVAPTIDTAAANATVQCDGQGNTAALQAWLTSNGGAAASDTCTNVTWSNNFDGLSDGCGNTGAATVIFTATDACGNTATTSAVFTIEDTTAPTIDTAASNATVQCDGQGNTAALQAWLTSNGGAVASDICSNVTWTNNFDGLSDGCGNTGSATVTFTATDDCGNTATTSATFTIEDTTAPTIDTAAANATVQCDGNGNTEALQAWLTSNGGAAASDICSGSVTWTNNFDGLSDGCGNTGSATVTFTATDDCGNTVTTSAIFTIEDTTAPTIDTAATNITVQCNGAGNTGALQEWLTANGGAAASDVCSGVTWTNNFASLSSDCSTAVTVTFTATDACGNAATTSATFTVEDTVAPTIDTAAANATVQCDGNGNTAALQAWLTSNGGAAASDTCTNVTWTNNFDGLSDGCGNTGAATVIFTATDACGNTATTSAIFTIEDTTAPTIDTAASNATVQCDGNGNTAALQAWLASSGGAAASDICSNVTWSNNFTALSDGCGNTGSATVTFTATDDCGNTATTSATFTIEDTTAPTIDTAAANATVQCDGNGNTEALQAWLTSNGGAAASDICSGSVTWTNNFDGLSDGCGNTGAATVTFTATDACGNIVTTSATFTIEDTTAPTIDTAAANATAQCDGNGNTTALQAWLASNGGAAASDLCSGNVTWTNNYTELSNGCGNTGDATVTFTATDACGNTATTSATFTIEDTTAPTIDTAAANATVECDGNGNADALQAWLLSNGGAAASDSCSTAVTWSNNFDGLSDGCGSTGTATVTFTATDDCGNTSTSSATFTIEDTTAPTIDTAATNATVQCDGTGNADALQAWLSSNGGAAASDICSNVTWSNNFEGLSDGCGNTGNVTVIFTATDDCGNTATTSATFAIEDTTAPSIDTAAANASVQCDGVGNAAALQAWLTSNGGAAASDSCSTGITWSNDFTALTAGCGNTGSATVTFTATDECGNASTTSATFTIIDNTAPVAPADPATITVSCIDDVPAMTSLTATDNCAGSITVSGTDSTISGTCANSFIVTRTWTFADACGNTSTTTQIINVSDTVAPTLNSAAPANTTASCDNIPAPAVLTATDNCGTATATVTMTETILQGSCTANYNIIRTWIATDACGNSSAPVSQTIAVSDTAGPTLVGDLPTKIEVNCDAIPEVPTLTFTDNCSAVGTPVFTQTQSEPIDGTYTITRTWTVSDACGNVSPTYTQFIIVTQVAEVISLPTQVTSNNLDVVLSLNALLPAGVTGGTWTNPTGVGGFDAVNGTFNPFEIAPADYLFSYIINDGACPVRYDVIFQVGFVADCQNIVIHNAFTPNGDGINEWFQIDQIGEFDCYPTNSVEIYNRWGVLVYETKQYDNSSKRFVGISEGRATVSKSEELPTGTYFYIIQWKTTDGQTVNKDGYLYLTR